MRVLGGECVELGEGELPYAPIVGALRPLARSGDPALDALSPAARAGLAQMLPGLGDGERGAARRRGLDRPGAPVRGAARAARAARPRGRAAADDRGPPLGRSLDARVPRLPRAPRCAASACWWSPATGPTSCTAATRCARCWPSSSATPAPAASSSSRSPARSWPSSSPTSSARRRTATCWTRLFARSEGNPLFAEELLAAGLDGRGALPPTLRDALMLRIERPRAGRAGAAAAAVAGRRLDHEMLADASGMDPRELREASARPSRRSSSSPTTRAATRSGTRCCARSWPTTCCPASAPSCTSRWRARWRPAPKGCPTTAARTSRPASPTTTSPAGDQPKALAASRARRRGGGERARLRRGRRALLARARAVGPRGRRRGARRRATTSELLRAAAWATGARARAGRAPRRCCARRSPSSTSSDPERAAELLERSRASSSPGPLARGRGDAPRARSSCCPTEPSTPRAHVLASARQGADARVALPRGGRGGREALAGRPRGRRQRRRGSAALDAHGRLAVRPRRATRRARRRCARRCALARDGGFVDTA